MSREMTTEEVAMIRQGLNWLGNQQRARGQKGGDGSAYFLRAYGIIEQLSNDLRVSQVTLS